MRDHRGTDWRTKRTWLLVLALTLAAAVPRVVNLGELSFYGDEETTALPARSVATGSGPTMPSGMTYPRALPLTYVNAATARVLGLDEEISYRLPAAILGALTVPLMFLFGRRLLGDAPALIAATLLLFSEWHLVHSRMARMYAPFLFFFLLAVWAVWRWARRDDMRSLLLAVGAVLSAATLHTFALFAVILALIPIGLSRWRRTSSWKLLAFIAAVGGTVYVASRRFYTVGYGEAPPPATEMSSGGMWQLPALGAGSWTAALLVVGAGLGAWAAARALESEPGGERELIRSSGLVITLALAGALACAGLLYGAGMFTAFFLLVYRGEIGTLLRRTWPHALAATSVAIVMASLEMRDLGLAEGLKAALIYPFPYVGYFAREFPLLSGVFAVLGVRLVILRGHQREDPLRAVVLATLLPLVAVGMVRPWGGMRFLLPAYPFFLLACAAGLVAGAGWLAGRFGQRRAAVTTSGLILVVLIGLFGNHSGPAAIATVALEHGQAVDAELHQQPFRPDHEGAGRFVRSHLQDGDVVVAEDPLQQRWYAGRVDYWFRRYSDARSYLYVAEGGQLRDIYVNSLLIRDTGTLDSLAHRTDGRLWFVTSGETAHLREFYLDQSQRRWLDSLESARRPEYVARDGITEVYCLNC